MDKFTELVKSRAKQYGILDLISEEGEMEAFQPPPVPAGTTNSDPNIDVGADVQEPVYTKPFKELAGVTYNALRTEFESLDRRSRYEIDQANAKEMSDDNQAASYFKLIEGILNKKNPEGGFNNVVESTARLMEMDANNGGAMGDGQMDAEMPAPDPSMEASPDPTGDSVEPMFDMPYPDLARLLDESLRLNFDDLESSQQRKLLALHPDEFKDDQQGVVFFKTLKAVIDEQDGPEPEEENVDGGGGFGPAAG